MFHHHIQSGSHFVDKSFGGGLPPKGITLVYGEAETGKTSFAIQCAIRTALMGLKTFYADIDGSFSTQRLIQIAGSDLKEVASSIVLSRPSSFSDQSSIINDLEKYVNKKFGLVVFDTITSLYRSELSSKKETYKLNRELNRQVAFLAQLANSLELSVLLTSQVSEIIEFGYGNIRPVATRVLRFWSQGILKLTRTSQGNIIRATVEKAEGKEADLGFCLMIGEEGLQDCDH